MRLRYLAALSRDRCDSFGSGPKLPKFPNRPIQLIVPYAAGGAIDQTARFLQQGLEKRLGQTCW